ncbi:MAG TPA: ATP-binding protein [Thermoanaerobaculia bacterium]|nr:ATP-binding protein [Thermoanaerobaculia bacterium]
MRPRITTAILAALTALCLLALGYALRQISTISVGLAAHDEVEKKLRESLDDQRKLAELDPQAEAEYRQRFESTRQLMHHLQVLALSREAITRRLELVLFAVVLVVFVCAAALYVAQRSRIREEQAQRIRSLEHLEAWQEAARRHAHEIRTPLTAARMEVDRLLAAVASNAAEEEISGARQSILEELDRLREFTRNFTSFASVPKPRPQPLHLRRFVTEFASTFASAWPALRVSPPDGAECVVAGDEEMLRQVLVNLCNNSALAGAHSVIFRIHRDGSRCRLDVIDDGPGIAPDIRPRLFEPYTTSRRIGEGMGLGLAISKKILLDHGGDLTVVDSRQGAAFRLVLPMEEAS